MRTSLRKFSALLAAMAVTGAAAVSAAASAPPVPAFDPETFGTATPIKHLVVIYQENVSFDHYFGTYPQAANPPGEPKFYPAPFTPQVNNLLHGDLLTANPNLNPANGTGTQAPPCVPATCSIGASNPFRLDLTQASTTDQNHDYTPEQQAFDAGKMDLFPLYTGTAGTSGAGAFDTAAVVMGYYDGNTVTAMWNYAQHFAMSDNGRGSTYGPSTPGALEAVAGQTDGFELVLGNVSSLIGSIFIDDGQGGYTDISDIDPAGDVCSSTSETGRMLGTNIGDLLNRQNISWGGFTGGFNLSLTNNNSTTGCSRSTESSVTDEIKADYIPHHNWFQYFVSTANPSHLRPNSVADIGHTYDRTGPLDPANHQYDADDFFAAVQAGNFPAVAYLKAPGYEDGHAGYSDPLDEQAWIVQVVNFIEQTPEWKDTAIIIDWDDSDGWYDHAFVAPKNASFNIVDQVDGNGECGASGTRQLPGLDLSNPTSTRHGLPVNGRCGPGPRLPFMVISPYARPNYVSHTPITQSSIIRFIEDNWLGGERLGGGSFDATAGSIMDLFDFQTRYLNPPLFLDEQSGEPVDKPQLATTAP